MGAIRPYKGHIRPLKAPGAIRKAKTIEKPFKAIKGHIRPYKDPKAIQGVIRAIRPYKGHIRPLKRKVGDQEKVTKGAA